MFRALNILGIGGVSRRPRQKRAKPDRGSDPELLKIWNDVRVEYFPELEHLKDYEVNWSIRRQRRTLASCQIRRKLVRVAKELCDPQFNSFLPALLYHEMCHAALGEQVGYYRGKRAWHGPSFKALESRHPGIKELDSWIKAGGWAYAVRRERAISSSKIRAMRSKSSPRTTG